MNARATPTRVDALERDDALQRDDAAELGGGELPNQRSRRSAKPTKPPASGRYSAWGCARTRFSSAREEDGRCPQAALSDDKAAREVWRLAEGRHPRPAGSADESAAYPRIEDPPVAAAVVSGGERCWWRRRLT